MITSEWHSGHSYYRVWKNNWCEQGGLFDFGARYGAIASTVPLHKRYKDTYYNVLCNAYDADGNHDHASYWGLDIYDLSTNSFRITFYSPDTAKCRYVFWRTVGFV